MNRLSSEARARVLHLLCEGSSIRAVTRLTGIDKGAVIKLMIDAGKACASYHDEHVRGLTTKRVQVDEIWSFTYSKQKNVATAKAAPDWAGDTWTLTAFDADSKLVVAWLVGGRDSDYAGAFIADVAGRLTNRVQLTSDGHKAYLGAVEDAFGADVDYAQLIKPYGAAPESFKGVTARPSAPASSRRGSRARPILTASARPTWNGRTSRCGCTIGGSRG